MVKVNICRDKAGNIVKFVVRGHSGFERAGKDIVCSAASAVAYTAAGAIEELIGLRNFYEEKYGFMSCIVDVDLSDGLRHDANVIMAAAEIGFKQIELAYPKHVKVMVEEV